MELEERSLFSQPQQSTHILRPTSVLVWTRNTQFPVGRVGRLNKKSRAHASPCCLKKAQWTHSNVLSYKEIHEEHVHALESRSTKTHSDSLKANKKIASGCCLRNKHERRNECLLEQGNKQWHFHSTRAKPGQRKLGVFTKQVCQIAMFSSTVFQFSQTSMPNNRFQPH